MVECHGRCHPGSHRADPHNLRNDALGGTANGIRDDLDPDQLLVLAARSASRSAKSARGTCRHGPVFRSRRKARPTAVTGPSVSKCSRSYPRSRIWRRAALADRLYLISKTYRCEPTRTSWSERPPHVDFSDCAASASCRNRDCMRTLQAALVRRFSWVRQSHPCCPGPDRRAGCRSGWRPQGPRLRGPERTTPRKYHGTRTPPLRGWGNRCADWRRHNFRTRCSNVQHEANRVRARQIIQSVERWRQPGTEPDGHGPGLVRVVGQAHDQARVPTGSTRRTRPRPRLRGAG